MPRRAAAVRDAVGSVEEGPEPRGVQLPGGDGACACVSGIWWEAFQPQQSWKAGKPVCQRPHKAPTLGRGDRALKASPLLPTSYSPGLARLGAGGLGVLWGEEAGERVWGLDTLLTSTWGVSAAAALTISEQSDPVLRVDFIL